MFWNNSSYGNNDRGKSVGGKMAHIANRYIQPKFMSKIGQTRLELPKEKPTHPKHILTKQNIPPQQTKLSSKLTTTLPLQKDPASKTPSLLFQKTAQIETPSNIYSNVRGLHNIGNTCYMNATLQCLFHLPTFNTLFYEQFNKNNKGTVSKEYFGLLESMVHSNNSGAINPVDFKKSVGRKKPRFLGNSQQDAQQFLTSFLQLINQQQTRIQTKPSYAQLENDPTKKPTPDLSKQWWQYYLKRDNSLICDIFQGQIISTVTCKKCQHSSVTFDNFWGIPVTLTRGKKVSELLRQNWQSQSLIDDYICAKCLKTRICSRTLDLFRLPKTLVIQLKRFEYGKYIKRKKNDQIKIELEFDANCLLSGHSPLKKSAHMYRLCGVIHHYGDTDYGHYTADVYSHKNRRWYDMDDSKSNQIQCDSYSKSAYLLFYEKLQ